MLRIYCLRNDRVCGEWTFDSSVGEVRVGRDEGVCQVALGADQIHVSRQHCAFRLVLGRYRLVLNQENPVWVDGKPAFEGQVLEPRCVLRIGKEGPKLRVVIETEDHLPSTMMLERTKQEHPDETIARAVAPVRRQRRWLLAAVASVAIVSAFAIHQAGAASTAVTALVERQPSLEEQQRIRQILAPESRPGDFAATLERGQAAVYMVVLDELASRAPIGTAWVVDRAHGLLATCAHVVHERAAETLLVRSGGEASVDLKVASVRLHPGYERFKFLRERHALPSSVTPGHNSGSLIPADDVALIEVTADARAKLGPDLPLASESSCAEIAHGQQVLSMGFPLEGVSGNYERPVARSQHGYVLAVSDFLLGRAARANSRLLHVSIPVAGGASGSPVFDMKGQVIGILSAGTFVFLEQQIGTGGRPGQDPTVRTTRIPTGVVNYAQRGDILHELLYGTATEQVKLREPQWKHDIERLRAEGEHEIVTSLVGQFSALLLEQFGSTPKTKEVVDRKQSKLVPGANPCLKSFELAAKAPGYYLVIATTMVEVDLDLAAGIAGEPQRVDGQIGSRAFVLLPKSQGGRLTTSVYTKAQPSEPVPFELIVVRFGF